MINPKKQTIFIKGKRIEFDSLPNIKKEELLTLWKIPQSKFEDYVTTKSNKNTSTKSNKK